jgi:hypothetical protein
LSLAQHLFEVSRQSRAKSMKPLSQTAQVAGLIGRPIHAAMHHAMRWAGDRARQPLDTWPKPLRLAC